MREQILQQLSKILTLVEFEVVRLKPKLNSVKSDPIDSQLIPLRLIQRQDFRENYLCKWSELKISFKKIQYK